MGVYEKLTTGIGVLCLGNHIGQIVDGLFDRADRPGTVDLSGRRCLAGWKYS